MLVWRVMSWNIQSVSYKLNETHSTRVEEQNSTSPIWCKAYTELIHAPCLNTSTFAKLPLTNSPGPSSFNKTSQSSWDAQKKGKWSGRSPRSCKGSDLESFLLLSVVRIISLKEWDGDEWFAGPGSATQSADCRQKL